MRPETQVQEVDKPGRVGVIGRRLHIGIKKPANWFQLIRFAVVGAAGYFVNLITYAVAVHIGHLDYRLAAVIAFMFAVINNFYLNRYWTFNASTGGQIGFQGARFFMVSIIALVGNICLLNIFVGTFGLNALLAQAFAIVIVTPINFVGNKLWSFSNRGA